MMTRQHGSRQLEQKGLGCDLSEPGCSDIFPSARLDSPTPNTATNKAQFKYPSLSGDISLSDHRVVKTVR